MNSTLRSLRVLTADGIRPADLRIEDGIISELAPYASLPGADDLGSRLLAPGLVDLHSDAVEKEIEPRPGANFPVEHAIAALDKKLAMCGITTMFHAVAFNDESLVSQRGTRMAAEIIRRIHTVNREHLGVDNRIHARYEVTSLHSLEVLMDLIDSGCIQLLSVMDHTPGQGQFKSIDTWKRFHLPVYDLSSEQADAVIVEKQGKQAQAWESMRELLQYAARHRIRLLSHDDDCLEKIDLLRELGVSISEFPLDLEVAVYARSRGMATGMGAPNVVRGRSQSGNIAARELISRGACDFLCSDYHPSSMLLAPYILKEQMGIPLEEGFRMITSAPAALAGLDDRGVLETGRIADIIAVEDQWVPQVVLTIKEGGMLYNGGGCLCHRMYSRDRHLAREAAAIL